MMMMEQLESQQREKDKQKKRAGKTGAGDARKAQEGDAEIDSLEEALFGSDVGLGLGLESSSSSSAVSKGPHPLKHKWNAFLEDTTTIDWNDAIKQVYSIETVEDFWALHDNLVDFTTVEGRVGFSLFKDGGYPSWESPVNINGGKIIVSLPLDFELWIRTALFCMSGLLRDDDDEVTGIRCVSHRGRWKIRIWLKTASQQTSRRLWQKISFGVRYPPRCKVEFKAHNKGKALQLWKWPNAPLAGTKKSATIMMPKRS